MRRDKVMGVYTASGGCASLNSGGPTFTGEGVLIQGCDEVLVGLAYKVPDDVGITFTWGLQYSGDLVSWENLTVASAVTTLVAAAIFVNVYGFVDNLQGRTQGGFLRVIGTAANFTNDTIQVMSWLTLGRKNGPIMNKATFRDSFAFDVTDAA